MNKWAFLLGAAAAVGVVVVVVSLALSRAGRTGEANEIPEAISDCFDRIHKIEAELQRLHAAPGPASPV